MFNWLCSNTLPLQERAVWKCFPVKTNSDTACWRHRREYGTTVERQCKGFHLFLLGPGAVMHVIFFTKWQRSFLLCRQWRAQGRIYWRRLISVWQSWDWVLKSYPVWPLMGVPKLDRKKHWPFEKDTRSSSWAEPRSENDFPALHYSSGGAL